MPRIPPELAALKGATDTDPIDHLSQRTLISEIDEFGCGEWTILYEYQDGERGSRCSYSGLLTKEDVGGALKYDTWDLRIGITAPGFSQHRRGGIDVVEYDRFGLDGIEPIVYLRNFHGIKPQQIDLSEEFRLFHNLYHDRYNDRFVYVDERGNETVVAEVTTDRVIVLTRFLRQYLAARQLTLALFFDHRADADVSIDAAKSALPSRNVATSDRKYSFQVGEVMGRSFSRVIGKKIIPPPPIEKSGVWPFETEARNRYSEFIINVGSDGSPIVHSCDPDALANYFGANEDAPHYLTPVWFKREVLAKYYDDPKRFSVEDGYLRCGSLWGLRLDNNLDDHVVVYLGDLGRDLHYEEQVYWKDFNVTPGGHVPSGTNFRRSFLAQFANPTARDLAFKLSYTRLNEAWTKKFGWPMFRPPHEADAYILKMFHVPFSENLSEFEIQLLLLVKLLVDSLNDAEFVRAYPGVEPNEKSISKLRRYLQNKNYSYADRDIALLRTLQDLRSTGAAHAKGKNFDKVRKRIGLDSGSPRDVFRGLLTQVNQMLTDLTEYFIPEVQCDE